MIADALFGEARAHRGRRFGGLDDELARGGGDQIGDARAVRLRLSQHSPAGEEDQQVEALRVRAPTARAVELDELRLEILATEAPETLGGRLQLRAGDLGPSLDVQLARLTLLVDTPEVVETIG